MLSTSELSPRATHAMTQIKQRIVDGTWPVGSRIPTETQLCELLGVGRNTIREAVHSLVHSGVLYKRQGSGTYVLAKDELTGAINRRIAVDGFRDCVEARRAIEVEAARLAAERRTDDEAAELVELLRELERTYESTGASQTLNAHDDLVRADLALHHKIVSLSRNKLLLSLYESIHEAIWSSIRTNINVSLQTNTVPIGDMHTDHIDVVNAIMAQDPEAATEALVRTFQHFSDVAWQLAASEAGD
ncbi:DNA-binding transcriptional regulator, FadR family [Micrococcales bacterium KH10]|nr:DNA-binding transcriptional regulator, FadR family [Micrococcales bacterium KH10]